MSREEIDTPIIYTDPGVEVPVDYRGKKYLLKQATGDAAAKWRNAVAKCAKFTKDGSPAGIVGIGDTEPLLVSLCLFFNDPSDTSWFGRPVPEDSVRAFAAPFLRQLFDRAKKISSLNEVEQSLDGLKKQRFELDTKIKELEEAAEDRKNDESALLVGSD